MFCWQKTILRMRPAVPPVRFCMLMINNTSCATFSANWSSVVRMCLLCSLNITYHKLYLHVFSPNISIRTSRHKHPHYVLMWRRIQFSCQQAGAEMWSVSETFSPHAGHNETIFQAPVPTIKTSCRDKVSLISSSCIPPSSLLFLLLAPPDPEMRRRCVVVPVEADSN